MRKYLSFAQALRRPAIYSRDPWCVDVFWIPRTSRGTTEYGVKSTWIKGFMTEPTSFIAPTTRLPEITIKVVVISIFLTLILAASNAYLALKIGILTSASIPAAILSMGILRFFKKSNILENNLIQTAASAGEAVAGGIVYTVPALILIHYWTHFSYWENFAIAVTSGILGVMFSVPLRRILVNEPVLKFPEGRAIAEVLIAGTQKDFSLKPMLMGGALGALMELAQVGLKLFASTIQAWFSAGRAVVGFGFGLSATMLGVGYLVGFEIGISLLLGAVIAWGALVPILSFWQQTTSDPTAIATHIWSSQIRYAGIGAMLTAGAWTLGTLLKPFLASMRDAILAFQTAVGAQYNIIRTEQDIPLYYVVTGILFCLMALYFIFVYIFPFSSDLPYSFNQIDLLWSSLAYILIFGFIAAAICGYFSGMVGVTATPGSAVIIASLVIATLGIRTLLGFHPEVLWDDTTKLNAAALAILIGAVITSIACIANDNIQDLKVGHLVGSTPWKQQVMLLFGVIIAAAIIPPIMQILFSVYGIGDVLPHAGMNITDALPAPPAAMMAAVVGGVFEHDLPWNMVLLGVGIGFVLILIQHLLMRKEKHFSVLGVAIGMYIPLATSTAIFIGSLLQHLVAKRNKGAEDRVGSLTACGLVTGAALMDVMLAIPFVLLAGPDSLAILPASMSWLTTVLGVISAAALLRWFYRQATGVENAKRII